MTILFFLFCFSSHFYARNMLTCGKVSIEMLAWTSFYAIPKKGYENIRRVSGKKIEFIASRRIEFISKRRLHIVRMDLGVQHCWIIKKIRFLLRVTSPTFSLFILNIIIEHNVSCVWFSFNGVYVESRHIANIFFPLPHHYFFLFRCFAAHV